MKRIVTSIVLIGFLTSLIALSSCRREDSLDANQDRIYTYYELLYDANEDVTTAKAVFRMGGPANLKLRLSDGSNVTFNGQELSYNSFYAYYQNEIPGFVETGTFIFTDLNGNSFTNNVSISSIEFPQDMEDIVIGETYNFAWIGDNVADDEKVVFQIDGPGESDTHTVYESQVGASSIELTTTETSKYADGASILSLEREFDTDEVNAPSVGGNIKTEYKATKVAMTVESE